MRVEVSQVGKKEKGDRSLQLLAGLLLVCGIGYGVSTPIIAEQMPLPVERALTNMRKDVDGLASSAMNNVDQTYRNITSIVGGR